MENNNKVGMAVIAFIAIIIGITLLSTTADSVWLGTDATYTITNESVVLANNTQIDLANDWVTSITTVALVNGTAITNYTSSRLETDNVARILYVSNTTYDYTGNTTYITYAYDDDNYIRSSSARVLIKLITLFFALGVMAIGLWGANKMGLLDFMKN